MHVACAPAASAATQQGGAGAGPGLRLNNSRQTKQAGSSAGCGSGSAASPIWARGLAAAGTERHVGLVGALGCELQGETAGAGGSSTHCRALRPCRLPARRAMPEGRPTSDRGARSGEIDGR